MITATAAIKTACMITLGSIFTCWTAKIIGNELNFMDKRTEVLKCLMTSEKELETQFAALKDAHTFTVLLLFTENTEQENQT